MEGTMGKFAGCSTHVSISAKMHMYTAYVASTYDKEWRPDCSRIWLAWPCNCIFHAQDPDLATINLQAFVQAPDHATDIPSVTDVAMNHTHACLPHIYIYTRNTALLPAASALDHSSRLSQWMTRAPLHGYDHIRAQHTLRA